MTCLLPRSEEGARSRLKFAELVFRREGQLVKQAGSARPFFMPLSLKTLVNFLGPRGDGFLAEAVASYQWCG